MSHHDPQVTEYVDALTDCKANNRDRVVRLLRAKRELQKERMASVATPADDMLRAAGAAHVLQDLIDDLSRERKPQE